jgi:hypothetical protein
MVVLWSGKYIKRTRDNKKYGEIEGDRRKEGVVIS